MRFMEWIRRKGSTCLIIFLAVFLVSLFAGLTISGMSFRGCEMQPAQQQDAQSKRATLTPDTELSSVVFSVNGHHVEEQLFLTKLSNMLQNARQSNDDPALQLYAYGVMTNYLINEEVTLRRGEELGIKITSQDIAEARDLAASQFMAAEEGSTGNVLGDLAQRMGSQRERKAAFREYLTRQGLSEESWLVNVRRELMIRKTREAWQAELDAAKTLEAAETKAIIDQRLADGESFEALSIELSEDPAGGGQAVPLGRGVVLPDQEEALFTTPIGELTEWIAIPAGWNRFEIVERQMAEGEDYEAERPQIIENLKGDREDYEPTEEEIARQYELSTARQILLKTSDPGGVDQELKELVDRAQIEINDPIVLAFQALNEGKLQPLSSMGYDELVGIASTAATGEDYDFGLIEAALSKGRGSLTASAVEDEAPAGDAADSESLAVGSESADGAEAGDVAETEAEPEPGEGPSIGSAEAGQEEPEEIIPIYAMAIGLFQLAIQQDEDQVGWFPYYMTARTYMDWLDDTDHQDRQPVDRDAARPEIETSFERAAQGREYSYQLHAARGLNLAWLERPDEALESLDLARRYAPHDYSNPIWEIVREAYEVLDNQEELEALEAELTEYRQAQLQAMIEQAQSQPPQDEQSMPFTIPGAGEDETPAAPETEAEGGEAEETEEAPAADDGGVEDGETAEQ